MNDKPDSVQRLTQTRVPGSLPRPSDRYQRAIASLTNAAGSYPRDSLNRVGCPMCFLRSSDVAMVCGFFLQAGLSWKYVRVSSTGSICCGRDLAVIFPLKRHLTKCERVAPSYSPRLVTMWVNVVARLRPVNRGVESGPARLVSVPAELNRAFRYFLLVESARIWSF